MAHDRGRRHTAIIAGLAAAALLLLGPRRAGAQLRTVVYASGLSSPIEFVQDPTDPAAQYVIEQSGRIRTIRGGALLPTPFLDMTSQVTFSSEQGLLGLAFAPDYATSLRLFVYF